MNFTVYDPISGRVLRSGICAEDDYLLQAQPGEGLLPAASAARSHYIKDGGILEYPEKPGEGWSFDLGSEEWVDLRTETEKETYLNDCRKDAERRVNQRIGELRLPLITDIPGQEMIYQRKEAEALSYIALVPEPESLEDFPFLSAEIGITAPTAYQLAQVWINMSSLLRLYGAQLEQVRLGSISQIQQAQDEGSIKAIVASVEALPMTL